MEQQPNTQYERELTKPIRFTYTEGKVKSFEADQTEAQWSLNIKKSILSLFNVNLTPKQTLRPEDVRSNDMPIQDGQLNVYHIYEVIDFVIFV